jgi:hypothetical protein
VASKHWELKNYPRYTKSKFEIEPNYLIKYPIHFQFLNHGKNTPITILLQKKGKLIKRYFFLIAFT